jgi:predicted  nucleic acid-binding Zn-ribbon protein
MLQQEEKERIFSVIYKYQKAYEKIKKVQLEIERLKTESLMIQSTMEDLRQEESQILNELKEKYGELDVNQILEEIKTT